MPIKDMLKTPGQWLNGSGEESEIILSSRIRIARNLETRRFTHNAPNEELAAVLEQSRSAANETAALKDSRYLDMGGVSTLERQFLAERHLVSREFLFNSSNRGLVVNMSEDLCLMINEEDHLRIQAYSSGLELAKAFETASRLDAELAPQLKFAYSERFGYLTACPTNLGTGLRASVLIHLPGLVHGKEIHKLLDSLRQLHHSIRGLYGEGTDVMGNFFQLSNSATLGTPENVIIANLREMVVKVIGFERRAREMLFHKARSLLEDKVWRAYGLLRHSRSVSSKEALSLISAVRLGVGVGLIRDLSTRTLNELLVYIQPAHLQMLEGEPMEPGERDVARADLIRKTIADSANHQED
ncbi:MAG: protein arginine kinase [Candidatus Latescibacterota bacterium]|nr:MAG: protein arginine kinase [Candidatus Latescibacterota bacterium]